MKISKTGKENGRLVKPKVFFSFLYEYPFAFIYQKYFKSTRQLLCVILQCTLMLGRGVNVNSITLQTEKKRGGKEDAVDSNKTYPLLGAQ